MPTPAAKTRNTVVIVAAALLLALAIVLIAIGVTTGTEAGLLSPENRWDHTPLTVGCEGYPSGREGCDTAVDAVDAINGRLGFEMLRVQEGGATDITVTVGVPAEQGGGHATATGRSHRYAHCDVTTGNTGTTELLYLTLYHELGCHCLGLAHDDYESSICFEGTRRPTPDRAFHPKLSDFDRELLRGRYGP
jgi:hypothetical protein